MDAPRELLNTERKDRLGNFIVSEIRTITTENITGRLSETGSGTADRTRLIISSNAITKDFLKLDSDGNEVVISSKPSLEAPFFGNKGYQIAQICGYYGTGIVLSAREFNLTDSIEITADNKERKTVISYSGANNSTNGCGSAVCDLSIIEMQVSYGNHDAKVKYDARTGVSSVIPLSLDSQFCDVKYNSAGYAGGGAPTFNWEAIGWSECSKTCGGGVQSSIYYCKRNDGQLLDNSYCSSAGTKPTPETRSCNENPCPIVNGVCGTSNNTTLPIQPSTNLCTSGIATSVSGAGPWAWVCTGANGGSDANCSANKIAPTPINGTCNNNVAARCITGIAQSDNGATSCGTTRTWTCNGSNGGSNESCSMINPVCITTGPYSYGPWSACSVSCGGGIRTRTETCGYTTCNNQEISQETCNPQACINYCILDATLNCEL